MLSDGKWGVNGVCVTWRDLGAEGPERVGERSEARVGDLRTREKMKRVEFGQHVRALAIIYNRGRVIKFCRTTVSVG